MKKTSISIIVSLSAALVIGIVYVSALYVPTQTENFAGFGHPDAITSGPLTITQSKFKIYENIFIIVSGLKENEKGNIRIFMPDGRLYKTLEYDGSVKSDFNSYFKPDTSATRKICEQEELVGNWTVAFDNNVYPRLNFEIINEHLNGPEFRLTKSC